MSLRPVIFMSCLSLCRSEFQSSIFNTWNERCSCSCLSHFFTRISELYVQQSTHTILHSGCLSDTRKSERKICLKNTPASASEELRCYRDNDHCKEKSDLNSSPVAASEELKLPQITLHECGRMLVFIHTNSFFFKLSSNWVDLPHKQFLKKKNN